MKQHEAVIQALENLNGIATLGQLYQETMKIPDCEWLTKTPFASIRRIVQLRSKEIYKIKPGLYGLVKLKKSNESSGIFVETEVSHQKKQVNEFNHTYYQGILLELGNLKKFITFAPNQDKNKMFLGKKKIDEFRILKEIPEFSYKSFTNVSSTIDVIWFNDRKMPDTFFEIEYTTDFINSLNKFNQLQDFAARLIIVADKNREKEFVDKKQSISFKDTSAKVRFLDYHSLVKQYENLIEIGTSLL
jgi:hypothetical protein